MTADLVYGLLPEHLLLASVLVMMLLDILRIGARTGHALAIGLMLAAGAVLVRQYSQGYSVEIIPSEVRIDRFALLAKLVILGCGLSWTVLFAGRGNIKSSLLLCSSLLGAFVVMDSAGFVSLVLGIEMLSLPALALIIHETEAAVAGEGAFKYLLLSSVASALLLFGIAFSYSMTGGLSIDVFAQTAASGTAEAAATTTLIAGGFFLKAAVFPFHAWAPDAYSAARVHVTAFLASVVKGAVILGLLRILMSVPLSAPIAAVVLVLALASIAFGNATAIRQSNFRRLLAYSSIAHAGYMLFAFADVTGGRITDLLWYVVIYALTVIVACASFSRLCPGDQDDVRLLDGAFQSHPVAALVFGLAMLSLAGLPPLPGFFAKLFVFRSVIASDHLWWSVAAFVGSFIGFTYYLGLFYRLFAGREPADAGSGRNAAA